MQTDRLARLRARMADTGTGAVIVGPTSNMAWLAGVSPHGDERPVLLVVTAEKAGFLMPALNAESVRRTTDLPFYEWADTQGPNNALSRLVADFGLKDAAPLVALDEGMRADFALLALDAVPHERHAFLDETIGWLRARKETAEYEALKASAAIDDIVMADAFRSLRAGMSERDVEEHVKAAFVANGARPIFSAICFGENAALPHHDSGTRTLEPGTVVLMDMGARHRGYPSDMTRVGYFGEEPEGLAEIHAIVERAVLAALEAARPGVRAADVDAAARAVIAQAGYGENFLHRLGHGLGVDIHEGPYLSAASQAVLEEGMVFSIEPGIYLAGRFGVRLEEIVIMRADGPEILSRLPRSLIEAA